MRKNETLIRESILPRNFDSPALADVNASSMVAGKGIHFDKVVRGRKKGQKLKEHEQFSAWYVDLKNGAGGHANAP